MQFVNRAEVKACMARAGFSQEDTAKTLKISFSSFKAKLQGRIPFKEEEMVRLYDLFKEKRLFYSDNVDI